MNGHPRPWERMDTAAIAGITSALRGDPHGNAAAQNAASDVLAVWPGARNQLRKAWEFHVRAACKAVAGCWEVDGKPWPAARSVVLAAAGYPPRWDGARLPHEEVAAVAPDVRCGYADAFEGLALLWEGVLQGVHLASAWQAPSADPEAVVAGAVAAGMGPPWNIHLHQMLQWLERDAAVEMLACYGRLLGGGSSIAISWAASGGIPEIAEKIYARVAEVAGVHGCVYDAGDAEAIIRDAGLRVHPHGAQDVRAWPGKWADGEFRRHPAPGRFLDVVALVPLDGFEAGTPSRERHCPV